LIRDRGITEASSVADEKGIIYSENFTEAHTSDPIFSNPHVISRKNFVNTKLLNLGFSSSFPDRIIIKELDKEQIITSTNVVAFTDDIDISIELGTGMNIEQTKPNVTTQTTQ
jgi:hypothetical protein